MDIHGKPEQAKGWGQKYFERRGLDDRNILGQKNGKQTENSKAANDRTEEVSGFDMLLVPNRFGPILLGKLSVYRQDF